MAVYHLFALEYNRIYNKLVQMKILTPEKKARRILIGVLQHITYKEFLPLLLGSTTLFSKNGAPLPYDKTLKPNVYNSFSVAYKMAIYSMLRDTYTGSQNTVVNMKDQWGKTTDVENKDKRDKLIEGMMKDASNAVDNNIACIFTNDCSTDKHEAKVDMVSDAIQDNRYLSLSVYVAWLALTKGASNIPTQFSELPYHSAEDKTKLQTSYQSVYDIDFMSAVLSEVPIGAALVGPTLVRLFTDQFKALMTGDRFFYEYEGEEKKRVEMKKITMAHIVCRNTALTTVNKEAFLKTSTPVQCSALKDLDFTKLV
ncbi:chorion peroxidase-like [Argonauta hians]